jgi:hypothetical protein
MFCAPELLFDGPEGIGSRFHVLRSMTHFQRYQGRQVQFSCFSLRDLFWAVPRALGPVFVFCAPGLIFDGTVGVGPVFMFCAPKSRFGGTEGVGSRFHVLRSRTRFGRYRGL